MHRCPLCLFLLGFVAATVAWTWAQGGDGGGGIDRRADHPAPSAPSRLPKFSLN